MVEDYRRLVVALMQQRARDEFKAWKRQMRENMAKRRRKRIPAGAVQEARAFYAAHNFATLVVQAPWFKKRYRGLTKLQRENAIQQVRWYLHNHLTQPRGEKTKWRKLLQKKLGGYTNGVLIATRVLHGQLR